MGTVLTFLPVISVSFRVYLFASLYWTEFLQGGGNEVWKSEKEGFAITSLAFHPTEQLLVFCIGNELHFWNWARSQPFAVCKTAHNYEKLRYVELPDLVITYFDIAIQL